MTFNQNGAVDCSCEPKENSSEKNVPEVGLERMKKETTTKHNLSQHMNTFTTRDLSWKLPTSIVIKVLTLFILLFLS